MHGFFQDLWHGFRILKSRPAFTIMVLLTLALGIGANTAVFSVVYSLVLRPLPYPNADRLAVIWETNQAEGETESTVSYPNFTDWRDQNRVFEETAAFCSRSFTLQGIEGLERVRGARVSPEFFSVLETAPAFGRLFRTEDEQSENPYVAVVSDGLWRRQFGGDPTLLGRTLTLNGTAYTVIGILPAGFDFPLWISKAEVWTLASLEEMFRDNRRAHGFRVVARLRPNATWDQAQAEMTSIAGELERQYPNSNAGHGANVIPLHEQAVRDARPALLILFGAVCLVLLIACANVANLLLARGSVRGQELAIRAAIGAGRARLVRQLLTESLILSLLGGGLGILIAFWSKDALTALLPSDLPRVKEISLNGVVLVFAIAISLGAGLVFGLAPALQATRFRLPVFLKNGWRSTAAASRHRLRRVLIVSEVAMALVLLVGAGLLIRSFQKLTNVELGFDPGQMLTFRLSVPDKSMSGRERAVLYGQILQRLEALPGVQSAAAATVFPHTDSGIGLVLEVAGHEEYGKPCVLYDAVSSDYFRTMRIPLLAGRMFSQNDTRGAAGVMLVNAAAARHFPNGDPLGYRLIPSARFDEDEPESFEIVGVVGDVRQSLYDDPEPHVYVPVQQQAWDSSSFALRTEGETPASLIQTVRNEIAQVTQSEVPYAFRTMEQYLSGSTAQRRFVTLVLGLFAATSLVLALIGIYGVLSYIAAQRTHEFGIRVALGARQRDVLVLVLKEGVTLTAIGVAAGLAGGLASTRLLASLLYHTDTADPLVFAGVSLLLFCVAVLACYYPARRATRIDPMTALKCE